MGIFKKKKLTPEELEEKSRKEKEWAEKCYRAGDRFAEKYNLRDRVERINAFVNKYPKSAFTGILTLIVGCFLLNMLVMKCSFNTESVGTDIKAISIQKDNYRDPVKEEINKLYFEMDRLNRRLEKYMAKDTLTRDDSLAIGRIILRMNELNDLIEGKELSIQDSLQSVLHGQQIPQDSLTGTQSPE